MINLNYTGAPKQDATQIEPLFSLGGFVSSSPVANDFYSNLFSEITLSTIENRSVEHIVLGLRSDEAIENIIFCMKTTKANQGRFRVAASLIKVDDCGNFKIPAIQNINSKPVNLKFHDCTNFFGETKIGFLIQPQLGDFIEIFSNGSLIGEVIYDPKFADTFILPDFQDDFEFEVRYNYVLQVFELFLIQKSIENFDYSIEVMSGVNDIGDIENQLPQINSKNLGNLGVEELLAIYIERTVSNDTIRENSKLNCEKHFLEYKSEFSESTTEKVELEIEYEEGS